MPEVPRSLPQPTRDFEMKGYYLLNSSSDSDVSRDAVTLMGGDAALQLVELASWWQEQPRTVRLDAPSTDEASEWVQAEIVDALDDPEALAYHSLDSSGRPFVKIGWGVIKANGGALWGIGESLLSALTHEFLEGDVDPYCDFMVDMFDGVNETPIEVCDAVQGDTYEIVKGSGRYVSNFLGPRWFGPENGVGPFDRMGLCKSPRELRPGGYLSLRAGGPNGTWSNTFGARMAAWMQLAKATGKTRRTRK